MRYSTSAMAIACAIAWASSSAQAEGLDGLFGDDAYVSVFGGANMARGHAAYYYSLYDILQKDGFSLGIAMGHSLGNGFRLEREISFVKNDNKSTGPRNVDQPATYQPMTGETSTLFMFTNLWRDIDLGRVRPYVGGGIGMGTHWIEDSYPPRGNGYDDNGTGLAVQLGGGVRYAVTDRLAVDAGYRLRSITDVSLHGSPALADHNAQASNIMHSFQLGASYSLGDEIMPQGEGSGDWYISLFGGAAMPNRAVHLVDGYPISFDRDTGFAVGATVGTHIADDLRAELEVSYQKTANSSYSPYAGASYPDIGNLKSGFVLGNVWKDFHLGRVSPYIGGGVGVGWTSLTLPGFNDRPGASMAGQFGAGARVALSDSIALDMGYRFKAVVDAPILGRSTDAENDHGEIASSEHVLQVGLTYGAGGVSPQPVADLPETPDSHYVSLFGGMVAPLDTHVAYYGYNYMVDFKNGFVLGAAIGGDITPDLRGELEASYVAYKPKSFDFGGAVAPLSGHVDSYYLMANLWRDTQFGMFQPYFGGGVGLAYMDIDFGGVNVDETLALAAQLGSGVRVPLSDRLTLDAGYRFKAALGVLTEGASGTGSFHSMATHYTHLGQIGVSWKF